MQQLLEVDTAWGQQGAWVARVIVHVCVWGGGGGGAGLRVGGFSGRLMCKGVQGENQQQVHVCAQVHGACMSVDAEGEKQEQKQEHACV